MGSQLLVKWTTQYFSLYQDCHHIPAAFCLQYRHERISLIVSENENIIRSSADSKWQACMRETEADRSWQAGHGEQGRSNARHTCFVTALHSWSRGLGGTCARTFLWKKDLRFGRWRTWSFKSGDTKRKHSVHADFRKNQKRSILRSEGFGGLTTAENKVLNEGRESWNNHRYAVVVQVLATQWNPRQTKTSQETESHLRKFTETVAEAQSYSYVQFVRIWQVLWRIIMESSNNYTSSIRDKRNCRRSCTSSKRRDISHIIAIWIGWWVVVGFYGVLLLSARWPRPFGRREVSKWTKSWGILLGHALLAGGIFGKKIFWLLR